MLLENEPSLRDDDVDLYLAYIEHKNPIVCKMRFADVLQNKEKLEMPNYDSISRARRKLQEKYPELRGSKRATAGRYIKFKEMIEYATE